MGRVYKPRFTYFTSLGARLRPPRLGQILGSRLTAKQSREEGHLQGTHRHLPLEVFLGPTESTNHPWVPAEFGAGPGPPKNHVSMVSKRGLVMVCLRI